ncbi:MAG: thiamine phosphate synthase [Phycisphaeraceae bacterium]|nr:thiamine phosphate synthase [Phycisphaeraceae bacterium]
MRAALRIIDANANRAMEAARTLEDAARFALNDAAGAARCKDLRHALRDVLAAADSPTGTLLSARNTPGDPGTSVTTEAESRRDDLSGICTAAGKRLGESLRVLEETVKLLDRGVAAAAAIKQLRYAAYDLEQRIVLALVRRGRAVQWPLCVLITESLCALPWEDVARRAIEGGAPSIQLREKDLPARELLARARRLVEIARDTPVGEAAGEMSGSEQPGVPRATVIINDRADIALAAGADGVHLGQDDLPLADARRLASGVPGFLIGVSTANTDQARRAIDDGADYVGLGPMFPSSTKPKEHLAGIAYLREFIQLCAQRAGDAVPAPLTPHLAISGITPRNVGELAAAGCRGVAVSSCVCSAPEPERVCRELLAAMAQPRNV